MVDQGVAQPTGRAVLTPSIRNEIPEAIPKVVSIRAGEGPADTVQDYGLGRAMTPAPTPVATEAVPRQHQPTLQVLQQPQVYDKQSRDVPRTVTRAGEGPADHMQDYWVKRTTTPAPAPVARQPQSTVQVPQQPQVYDNQSRDVPRTVARAGESPADYMQEYGVRRTTTPAPAPVATDAVPRRPQSTMQVLHQQYAYDKQSRDAPRTVARAGEGPADYIQEYGVRRTTTPAPPAPVATDAVARQPQSTMQVLHQQHAYDKQSRDVPQSRTVAGAQLDPASHPSAMRVSSPQPWVQPALWSTEPRPMSPVPHPPVVPSPMVFSTPLASPPTLADTPQPFTPPRSAPHGHSSHQESTSTRDIPWHSSTVNGRQPAPPVHSHTAPLSTGGRGQRASPQGASPMVHEAASSKHARSTSLPVGYANSQPSYVTSPQSRPIAPGLATAFPIREDNVDMYRHLPQTERPQDPLPPKDALNWDRHRHNPDNAAGARMVVSTVPSNERTPRSTKASPSLHPRPVNQGTPPKPPLQPFDAPTQSSTNPNVSRPHDSSRPSVYNMANQNSNPSPYPATPIYPSSSRAQVEANSAVNNPPVANASPNNPSPKIKPGHPSPRSRPQVVASLQGATPPVAVHITTRTPSHETGSTTLLGQAPSSQGSASLHVPTSPPAHQQAALSRVAPHSGQQIAHASVPVSDSLGDRNANAINHAQVPSTRQSGTRHHHSNSAPVVSVPSLVQSPPPVQSQIPPPPRSTPLSPTPVRSYPTTQAVGDFQVARTPFPGYSPSMPRQQRDVIPSPSQESELNTPSSLAISTKLPIVSDEPLAPVMSTQSLQEPKKKSGFFQGLGIFRSKSSAQKRHPHESKVPDSRAQMMATTTPTKQASHKSHTPLHYDSDSKVITTPVKLKKSKPVHVPMSSGAPKPPQPKPIQVPVPTPSFAGATEEKFSSAPNAFASFRVMSKRYRTMSGASAEAVDGTNAGVCPTFSKN